MTDSLGNETEIDGAEEQSNPTYIQLGTIYPNAMVEDSPIIETKIDSAQEQSNTTYFQLTAEDGQNYTGPVILGTTTMPNQSKIYIYHTGLINPCIIQPLMGSEQVLVESGAIKVVCDPYTLYTIDQSNPDDPTVSQSQPTNMPMLHCNSAYTQKLKPEIICPKGEEIQYIDGQELNSEQELNILDNNGGRIRFSAMKPDFNISDEDSVHSPKNNYTLDSISKDLTTEYIGNNVDDRQNEDNYTLETREKDLSPTYIGNNDDDIYGEIERLSSSSHESDPSYSAKPETESDSDVDYIVSKYSLRRRKKRKQKYEEIEAELFEYDDEKEKKSSKTPPSCNCPNALAMNVFKGNSKKRKYPCNLCSSQFYCEFHFNAHQEAHQFPYECSVCFSRFPLAVNEDIHFRYKHCPGELRFHCRICLENLRTEKNYNLHYPLCCKAHTIRIKVVGTNAVENNDGEGITETT